MTDQELLSLAAKAADITFDGVYFWGELGEWNPLDDDGDALRLAVKLDLVVHCGNWLARRPGALEWIDGGRDDPYAATRRAIVRAAAEIGKEVYAKT